MEGTGLSCHAASKDYPILDIPIMIPRIWLILCILKSSQADLNPSKRAAVSWGLGLHGLNTTCSRQNCGLSGGLALGLTFTQQLRLHRWHLDHDELQMEKLQP